MRTLPALLPVAGFLLMSCAPKQTGTYPTVSVQDLKTAVDSGASVLDVRTQQEFAEGHIASAVNLPLDEVAARASKVPGDKPVYVICRSGNRSAQASELLKKAGKDVKNVGGGMNDWVAAGYPVTQ
ncbi:rhodanese-like domain-containing protein [Deinococcus cavernae]|uniref:Rhodanese-like domain-containing protein n=1 Tax=Deinococcus cavernae TaxID=2320857 RepID=A0A418V732_9DEIO|nr:rhodanese-like domain-containing protein [Deinococcus cavernae]RJF71892.1 rhodanese-like domain-containing protein [Deinococcus cavernae]